jgi:haloalkane dehalogenase
MNAAEFHSSRQFTQTPYGRIAHLERGSGPAVLFMHGFPLNSFQWRDVIEDLAPARRCLAPDLMGLGYSEIAAEQDISFESQAKMLAAFLDDKNARQVDIVANDSGGGMSQVFAAAYPERVRSLTLTNCEVADLWMTPMLEPFFAALATGVAIEGIKVMCEDQAVAHSQLGPTYENVTAVLTPEVTKLYLAPLVESEKRCAQLKKFGDAKRNMAQIVAAGPRLRESKFPTQVIWGEADTAFNMEKSLDWLRKNIGGMGKVTLVPRAKLFWPEEHPRLLSVMLREFWASHQ